jgi:hypothetical protein
MSENNRPLPKMEYFKTPHAFSGVIIAKKAIYDCTIPFGRFGRGPFVWRVWVRIRTDEGWVLMGYIGKSQTQEGLPDVRFGDRVELAPMTLGRVRGSVPDAWTPKRDGRHDYRSNRRDRQLSGKIIRKH